MPYRRRAADPPDLPVRLRTARHPEQLPTERDRLVRRQEDAERHGPVGRLDLDPGPVPVVRPRATETNPPSVTLIVLGSLIDALPMLRPPARASGPSAAGGR